MKKITISNNAVVLLSQNELGYDKVLNDFDNTNKISIVTFNISHENVQLIDRLKKMEDVQIEIVTNIPSRFDSYYYHKDDKYRKDASMRISKYLDFLNPDSFESNTSVYFNFRNHSKIMATDNYAYIGSANYSSESSRNFESGILISDSDIVNKVRDEFISEIIGQSVQYFGEGSLSEFMVLVNEFLAEIEKFDELYLDSIFARDLSAKENERCVEINFYKLDFKEFENFRYYIAWFVDEMEDLPTRIENQCGKDISKILSQIKDLVSGNDVLEEFACFNEQRFFQGSYEDSLFHDTGENTDELLQMANEATESHKEEITEEAIPQLEILDDLTQELLQVLNDLTSRLCILRDNEMEIDNTK